MVSPFAKAESWELRLERAAHQFWECLAAGVTYSKAAVLMLALTETM
jgi:hypothetical protein